MKDEIKKMREAPAAPSNWRVRQENRKRFESVLVELQRTKTINFDLSDMSVCNWLPVGLSIHQASTGKFIFTNKRFARALGFEQDELEFNQTWCSVSNMVEAWEGYRREAFRNFGREPKLAYEWRHASGQTVAGTLIPNIVSANLERDSIDLVICISLFAQDYPPPLEDYGGGA